MLQANSTNRITFTVGVHGTAAVPSVRCLLGDNPALAFQAVRLHGDQWEVQLKLPANFPEGTHRFRIEVHLNGRVFTPINQELTVSKPIEVEPTQSSTVQAPDHVEPTEASPLVAQAAPVQVSAEPNPAPSQTIVPPGLVPDVAPQRVDAVVAPRIQLPEAPHVPVKLDVAAVFKAAQLKDRVKQNAAASDLLNSLRAMTTKPIKTAPAQKTSPVKQEPIKLPEAPELKGLQTVVSKPVQKLPKRVVQPAPSAPVKINMAAVANEATMHEDMQVQDTKRSVVVEDHGVPVTLIKGGIILR